MRSASRRRMRTHAEWNVDTHILAATGPISAATRVFISSAALLVKVMARISNGLTPRSRIRWAMRWVRTRVLPDPAPATTSRGPSPWATASRCTGLSPSSMLGALGASLGRSSGAVIAPPMVRVGRDAAGPNAENTEGCVPTVGIGENPAVKVQRLSSTDGFIVWDLDDATSSTGVVRLAPKVLQDGAVLLARSTTYGFASFGVATHAGASAAINAKPDGRDAAVAAFVEEVRPLAEAGRLSLAPALGTTAGDLAPLGWSDPDPALAAAGAIAASRVAGPLDWRTAAVVGSGPVVEATTAQLSEAGATIVDSRFDAACDVLFVAGKAGCLDHATADTVKASIIVPLTAVPVTARALAV